MSKNDKIDLEFFDNNPVILKKLPEIFTQECCDCGMNHIVFVEKCGEGVKIGFVNLGKLTDLARYKIKHKKKKRGKNEIS